MSTINYLPLRSTITYQANGSPAGAGLVYTTLNSGQQVWNSVISPEVVTLSDSSAITSVTPALDYSTFGQNWTNVAALSTSATWQGIAMSATGQYQVATGATDIGVFYSSNYGQTWSSATGILPNNSITGITMSSSGQYACCCVSSGSTGNGIWYSSNYGASWTLSNAAVNTWASIAMSATGQYVSAVANTVLNKVWVSSDYGHTWAASTTALLTGFTSISISATGQYQYVASTNTTNTGIYYSTTFGSTWTLASLQSVVILLGIPTVTPITTAVAFTSISCSASGQYVTAVTASASGTPGVYVSTNYGVMFTLVNSTPLSASNMTAVAMNASGQYQVALATAHSASGVWYSADFGVTWTLATSLALSTGNTWTAATLSQTAQYVAILSGQGVFGTMVSYPLVSVDGLTSTGSVTASNLSGALVTSSVTYPDGSVAISGSTPLDYTTFAQTFSSVPIPTTYGNGWFGCAMSATGQYQTVTSTGGSGDIYYSKNFGQTWTQSTGLTLQNYVVVRMSASGQYQLTGVGSSSSNLYISSNYGVSWSSVSSPVNQWTAFAVSASGKYQYAAGSGTKVYVSSNYGITWNICSTSATAAWSSLACSSSGQTVIGCINASSGYLYVSNNYGATWTQSGLTAGQWTGVACSATGQIMSACIVSGGIYYTTNYGATWSASNAATGTWQDICCSASGQYQLACANAGGYVYYSIDNGATWTSTGSTGPWQRLCMSASAQYLLAVGYGGATVGSTTGTPPAGSLSTAGSISGGSLNVTGAITGGMVAVKGGMSYADGSTAITASNGFDYGTFAQNFVQTTLLPNNMASFTCSATGQYMAAYGSPGLYSSSNYGQTWTISNTFNGVGNGVASFAMSASGQYQALGINMGYLYYSSDYGQTWTQTGGIYVWSYLAMSASGQYVTATNYSNNSAYYSSDYGHTYTYSSSALSSNLSGVAMSASGQYQCIVALYVGAFYSSDYGHTWTPVSLSNVALSCVSMSASGQYVTAGCIWAGTNPSMYYSTNYGQTFTKCTIPGYSNVNSAKCCMSASGQYQMSVGYNSQVWYSTTYGVTWSVSTNSTSVNWIGCCLSSNAEYGFILDTSAYINGVSYSVLFTTALSKGSMWLTNSNVGIANMTPTYLLDVGSTGRFTGGVQGQPDLTAIPATFMTGFAQTWVPTPGISANTWNGATMSATGQYQSVSDGSEIKYSSNYGATWASSSIASNSTYCPVSMSASGQYQLTGLNVSGGGIYMSVNYGQSFNYLSSGPTVGYWTAFCLSSTGQYAVAVSGGGHQIWRSANYGATWTQATVSVSNVWADVCCSNSGQFVIACASNGVVAYSSDYGVTYTNASISGYAWWSIACSASGQYVTVCADYAYVQVSVNYGQSWSQYGSPYGQWFGVAMSASGQYQVIGSMNSTPSALYYSTNYGDTWTATSQNGIWGRIAMSQNGMYLLAADYNVGAYSSVLTYPSLITTGDIVVTGQVSKTTAVLARKNAGATVMASGSPTAVQWDTADSMSQGVTGITFNGASYFSNYNAGKTYVVMVTYSVAFASNSTGIRTAYILHNSVKYGMSQVSAVSGDLTYVTGSAVLTVPYGATFYIEAIQTSGGTLGVGGASSTVQVVLF